MLPTKLRKFRMNLKDKLSFLGFDYRDAYLVVDQKKKLKNEHVLNRCVDFLVTIIDMLRFL